ncbi:uncharacterized protein CTRU02_201827 [Colletotrichum truncatum]|uniref:Uncharacterized protein n=1 Tax=Colletotrichum truncatum TaxID=5467 RepID=A0ACC3ZIL5_COLTU|nr:uncharacterized protein CTRU02_06939 [Colletotrichum truncatum]KAF6791755.1 hypothetical protein CTRU02_06939 [Colletotrichum truncatum]
MSLLQSFSKWLHLKQYQLEVTYSVYIFTPLEKFIFYTVLFLLSSLTFIATVLYLPQHIAFIANRAWFYMHGDPIEAVVAAVEVTKAAVESVLMAETTTTAAALAQETVEIVREL